MAAVLITGSSGLIGSWLHRCAEAGGDLDLTCVSSQQADLLAPGAFISLIDRVAPDVVVHLAWSAGGRADYRGSKDNATWVEVSLGAAERCRSRGARFIGVGTVLDDRAPSDAYSRSKRDLRRLLEPWLADGSISWLRPYYVIDPDAGRPQVLAAARAATNRGEIVALREPGSRHDFVHAADVASAIFTVVRSGLTGVVDIGSGRLHSVADLVSAAGYSWRGSTESSSVLHDDRAADTRALHAAGWAPLETNRFFSDD